MTCECFEGQAGGYVFGEGRIASIAFLNSLGEAGHLVGTLEGDEQFGELHARGFAVEEGVMGHHVGEQFHRLLVLRHVEEGGRH